MFIRIYYTLLYYGCVYIIETYSVTTNTFFRNFRVTIKQNLVEIIIMLKYITSIAA